MFDEVRDLACISRMESPLTHISNTSFGGERVMTCRWTQNGLYVLTREGGAYQVQGGTARSLFRLPHQNLTHAAWNSEGKHLAVASLDGVFIWDSWLKKQIAEFPVGTGIPNSVSWSPMNRYLAIGARAIFVFDPASLKQVHCFDSHPAGVTGLDWSPDGALLISADDWGGLRIHDLSHKSSFPLDLQTESTMPSATKWSPCGRKIYCPDGFDGIALLSISGSNFRVEKTLTHHSPRSIAFLDELSGGGGLISWGGDGYVRIWRVSDHTEVARIKETPSGYVRAQICAHPFTSAFVTLGERESVVRTWEYSGSLFSSDTVEECEPDPEIRTGEIFTGADQKKDFSRLLKLVEEAQSPAEKGKSLENLMSTAFLSVSDFSIFENVRTETEEIDLWIENGNHSGPFAREGELVLVECKNWSTKCGKNEFVLLREKAVNRGERCTLAFLISWNGFADTITKEMLRGSREKLLIVPIDGETISAALEANRFPDALADAKRKALRV